MIKRLFINETAGRLRAGWRILLFMVLLVGVNIALQTIFKISQGGIPQTTDYLRTTILIAIVAITATCVVPFVRRVIDRKSLASMGLKFDHRTLPDILFGFALSGVMAGVFFLIVWQAGLINVSGLNWSERALTFETWQSLGTSLAVMSFGTLLFLLAMDMVVSWWEELVFRGYLFHNFVDGMGLPLAILVSCLLYGGVHAFNPNATLLSSAIIVAFGLLRLYGLLATGALWLSFGMHTGWNFFQGPVFGFKASGNESAVLIVQERVGPAWLSGGEFGPEGSVIILPILLSAGIIMWMWTNRDEKHSLLAAVPAV